jgi:hypothetical protein
MQTVLLRLASLACGLVLTLPPGWCCWWLPGPARAAAAPAEAPAEPCCPCCCHPAQPTEPATPAPAPPRRCPCADRAATTPQAVKPPALQAGDGPAAVVPAADLAPSAAPNVLFGAASPSLPSAPLNVLHCVWLC